MTERGAQLKSEIRAMERQEYQYSGLTLDLPMWLSLSRKIISNYLKSVYPNVEIALSGYVHDGDQLYRGTFIFRLKLIVIFAAQ